MRLARFRVIVLPRSLPRSSQRLCRPTFPVHSTVPLVRDHAAFAAFAVLFGRPTACRASLLVSFFAYRGPYSAATRKRDKRSWGHARYLPCRAVRKHLGAMGEWIRLRLHTADSTLPRLWPTGSSSGQPPIDYGPAVLFRPFGLHLAVDTLPSPTHAGASEELPPLSWIWFLHLRTRGTLTLPIRALPSAHYALG